MESAAKDQTPRRSGVVGFASDLREHIGLMGERMPAYRRLLHLLAEMLDAPRDAVGLLDRFSRAWQARTFEAYYERPLLILAALRADAMVDGPSHPLWNATASTTPDPNQVTVERLGEALAADRLGLWSTLRTRRVQTNDTSRALVWLWPAGLAGCSAQKRPLVVVDIGASAGLNLIGDALPTPWRDTSGQRLALGTDLHVAARLGLDARPLDVRRDDDVAWLRACIWPGETARLTRLEASVAAMRKALASANPPRIERLQAVAAPRRIQEVAAEAPADAFVIAYQTFVAGYFTREDREAYTRGMSAWLSSRAPCSATWLELEIAEEPTPPLPALCVAHVLERTGKLASHKIGYMSYHPSEVHVLRSGVTQFQASLSGG